MGIKIVPYTQDEVPAVRAFNARMLEGETNWGWYEHPEDEWLPTKTDERIWREHYLAVDDDDEVRGAYALKPQQWFVRGQSMIVADWQGPVSEGLLSRRYAALGLRMIRDMLTRYPLLYSWGHGGKETAMLKLLVSLKWLIHDTPFCLKVLHPFRFMRLNRYLRDRPRNRLALDFLAFTGLGWVGLKALHFVLALRGPRHGGVTSEEVSSFGDWADDLWEGCRGAYQALGLRDAATMNAVVAAERWPHGIRLRVQRGGKVIGWAVVLDNQLENDARFGNLRVGCVADCLAMPEDAGAVIAAATRFVAARGVDMIASNQAHPAWIEAFSRMGFLILERRRSFAVSPALQDELSPFAETRGGLHLTNMDGHGPHGF